MSALWVALVVVVVLGGPGVAAGAAPRTGFVYAVCNGSRVVAQYRIGSTGVLSPLSPANVPTNGLLSIDIAVARNGKSAYVTDTAADNVGQYAIDPKTGVLSPMMPPTVPSGSLDNYIALSPNGRDAYVTNTGDNTVSQYSIDPTTGALVAKSPPTVPTGPAPEGITVSPDGASVYVANAGGGLGSTFTLSQFSVNRSTGTLSPKSPATVVTGDAPSHVAVSPNGNNAYITNSVDDTISQYSINPRDGTLTPLTPPTVAAGTVAPGGGFLIGMAVTSNGHSVYVANGDENTIWQFNVNQRTGALTPKTPTNVAAGNTPVEIAVTANGKNAYVTNIIDNTISEYNIDPSTGILSPGTPATIATAVAPDGITLWPQS
jgi:6-phosphogluconolactonase